MTSEHEPQPVWVVARAVPWRPLLNIAAPALIVLAAGVLLYRFDPYLVPQLAAKVVPVAFAYACALFLLFAMRDLVFPLAVLAATSATVTETALVLGDRPAIPRSRIVAGHVRNAATSSTTSPPTQVVVLRLDDGELLLRCRDAASGQRLLAALELDRKAMRFRAVATAQLRDLRQWWPMFVPAFFPLVVLVFVGDVAVYVAGAALLIAAAFVAARNSELWWRGKAIHVGADGVCIEAPERSRFIPYGAVAALEASSGVLVLRSSEKLRLIEDPRDGASLSLRLTQTLARFNARAAPPSRARAFTTADPRAAYRSDVPTTDEALDVLEDPSAVEAVRVAAATWLARAPGREGALPRLRVAAHETASPRVRVAIEAAEALAVSGESARGCDR